jgi:polyhydroxyalkanoate synthase
VTTTNPTLDSFLEAQKNFFDEGLKAWSRFTALPKAIDKASRIRVGTTPHDVVYEEDTLKLLRYRGEQPKQFREPLLICYALVNRPYILDLQPNRSVVQQLLKRGFDVYLIDWGVATAADRTMRLQDYICGLLNNVVHFVLKATKMPQLNLLGYCMGGTMSTMYTALNPELIHTLSLMAAPIDFAGDDSLLHVWTQEKYFDVDRFIDAYGNCPAPLLQSAFQLMKPVQNYYLKYTNFWENVQDEKFVENFWSMETWGQDNIPVAGETFREFVKCLYQQNQLVKGEFRLRDVPVRLERITCPLLLLAAEHDHLVTPASTMGIVPHVKSTDVKKMLIDAGHVGLAVSSKAHKKFWPEAVEWIAQRSSPLPPP